MHITNIINLLATLALSACAQLVAPPAGQPELSITTPTGIAVVRLVATQPALTQALVAQVGQGRYGTTNVVRAVPHYFALVGDTVYDETTPVVLPPANPSNYKPAVRGQVGLLTLPSGGHGPELIFMLGNRWSTYAAPSNTLVGHIISGRAHLQNMLRGDKISIHLK